MSQNRKKIVIAAILGAIAIGVLVAYFAPLQKEVTITPISSEEQARSEALGIAQAFVLRSPTFAFDGIAESLHFEQGPILESNPPQYIMYAKFDSTHAGFGDRTGQMLAQIITSHTVEIRISDGVVLSAVTDNAWDELNSQSVKPQSKLVPSDESVTPFDGEVTDYASLIDSIKSRGIKTELVENLEDSSFSVPTRVVSVGGANVQVYEFQSESDAQNASHIVSEDGTKIGNNVIRWIDTPHFYTKGKIIVQYVGQNPEILNLFDSIFGKQFAGM